MKDKIELSQFSLLRWGGGWLSGAACGCRRLLRSCRLLGACSSSRCRLHGRFFRSWWLFWGCSLFRLGFRLRRTGQNLYFLRHGMQQVWRRVRRIQNRGENVDWVENVLVDCEEDLGNLGFWVRFQFFLNIRKGTFQSHGAWSWILNDIRLGGYNQAEVKRNLVAASFLLFKVGVHIEKKLLCRRNTGGSFSVKTVHANGNDDACNRIFRADTWFPYFTLII